MQDDLPLSKKGRMISSTGERSTSQELDWQFAFILVEALKSTVVNALVEELLIGSVGANFRQSQHDVHLLSSTIVYVDHQTEMGDTHSQ